MKVRCIAYRADQSKQCRKTLRVLIHQICKRIQLIDQNDNTPHCSESAKCFYCRNWGTHPIIEIGKRFHVPWDLICLYGEQDSFFRR